MSLTCQWPSLTFRIAVGNFAKTSTLDRDDVFSIEGGESKTLPSGYEYVLIKGRLWYLGAITCCRWYICILSNTCVWKQTTLLCRFVCFLTCVGMDCLLYHYLHLHLFLNIATFLYSFLHISLARASQKIHKNFSPVYFY